MRYGFQRVSGLPPGTQSADNYKRTESLIPQHERHPGARGFACSSAVDVNVPVLGQVLDFLDQIVGLDPHRSLDPLRLGVVIAVASHIDDENRIFVCRSQSSRYFCNRNSGRKFIDAIFLE